MKKHPIGRTMEANRPTGAELDRSREAAASTELSRNTDRDTPIFEELTRQQFNNLHRWLHDYCRTHAAETNRALKGDWRHFAGWCASLNLVPATVTVGTVTGYMASLRPLAAGTIRRRGVALLNLFEALQFPEADQQDMRRAINIETRALIRLKAESEETEVVSARPLRWKTIVKALTMMDGTDIQHVRNRAMVRLAYDGMLRRSELVRARVQHLRSVHAGKPLGRDDATLRLPRSKTDQEGKGARVFCRQETSALVADWIRRAQLQEDDYLFPSFQGRSRSINRAGPMHAGTVNAVFRWVAKMAGETGEGVTGHSCRRGAAQDMIEEGLPLGAVIEAGRWRSAEMVLRYIEGMDLIDGAVARLADLQGATEKSSDTG